MCKRDITFLAPLRDYVIFISAFFVCFINNYFLQTKWIKKNIMNRYSYVKGILDIIFFSFIFIYYCFSEISKKHISSHFIVVRTDNFPTISREKLDQNVVIVCEMTFCTTVFLYILAVSVISVVILKFNYSPTKLR